VNVYLFDIDGTLLNSAGAGRAALERGLEDEFGVSGVIDRLTLSGRTDTAIISDLCALANVPSTPENRARIHAAYLRHLPDCLASHQGRTLPGVEALLEALLARQDAAVGLLTGNVLAGARLKLGHFDLWRHFAFGGYGDKHHDRDDVAREALAAALGHVGRPLEPARVWVIGDTPHDVRCARAIGARAVAVTTGWHSREQLAACAPDLLLDDLSDPCLLFPA
jgi:phosphoglycolate phosphatase-like HAD superfamily hydrolase